MGNKKLCQLIVAPPTAARFVHIADLSLASA
jgi:hypothetical protein